MAWGCSTPECGTGDELSDLGASILALRDYLSDHPDWEAAPLRDRLNYIRSHGREHGCKCTTDSLFLKNHEPLCPSRLAGEALLEMATPCIPPSQDTEVEKSRSVGALSDEDAAKIGRSLMATIDANREHPLLKDWTPAEDPAEIVGDLLWAFDTPRFLDNTAEQVYPSDAEIYDEWVDWFGGMLKSRKKDIYEFARVILSKSPPSISPETLHKLWSLAQTEAQEQFMIDPRGILSGAGKA